MATIRAYTDLEQSKKLAKILPLESADMYYLFGDELDNVLAVCSDNDDDNTIGEYAKEAFKAGAKWQKKQMMKDVIDAHVIDTKGNYPSLAYGHIDMMFALEDMKVTEGDKVKLIIIKED